MKDKLLIILQVILLLFILIGTGIFFVLMGINSYNVFLYVIPAMLIIPSASALGFVDLFITDNNNSNE